MYWLIPLQIQVNVTFCYFIQIKHYLKNQKYQYIHEYIYIVHVIPNILHKNPPPFFWLKFSGRQGIEYGFLPIYSPDFNLVENCF